MAGAVIAGAAQVLMGADVVVELSADRTVDANVAVDRLGRDAAPWVIRGRRCGGTRRGVEMAGAILVDQDDIAGRLKLRILEAIGNLRSRTLGVQAAESNDKESGRGGGTE